MDKTIKAFQAAPLEYFTDDQMREIHSASLHILEEIGTRVHNDQAIDRLKKAGAHVRDGNLVLIPGALAEWAVRQAPSRVALFDRPGNLAMSLENRNVYYGTGSDCPGLLDTFTGEHRDFLSSDVDDSLRLVDALQYIDFTMCNGLAPDIPINIQYQDKYARMIRNTTKPQVITAGNKPALQDIVEMASAVRGGLDELIRKPIFVLYDEPTSPLVHSHDALEKLMYMAETRQPTNYSPGMMAGGTGPVTMAGAIALANAEILSGLVIHQLTRPGAPFVFGAGMSPMDMQSGQPTYSAPEAMIEQAGLCQIGRKLYNLPTWGFAGCGASKLMDEQAVNEASTYIMMAAWMGTNLVHDVGYIESGLTYSYDLLVICNEIIGQVRRMMEGIRIDVDNLALEAIKRVGPGGHFLSDVHTFAHYKNNWTPELTDRKTRESWANVGGKSMGQKAREKIERILSDHKPEPLPEAVNAEVDKIMDRAAGR